MYTHDSHVRMSDTSTRYVEAATWHWLSDGAANIAYALCIAIIVVTPVIPLAAIVGGGVSVMVGVELAFVCVSVATILALYLLGVSFVLAEFQQNGLPFIT